MPLPCGHNKREECQNYYYYPARKVHTDPLLFVKYYVKYYKRCCCHSIVLVFGPICSTLLELGFKQEELPFDIVKIIGDEYDLA